MAWMRGLTERWRGLFFSRGMDAEMDEELRFHLEQETEKNIRAGMDPRDAHRKAMVDFGGVERYREKAREERGVMPLENFFRDLRFALRTLRKSPGVVVVTVLSLGLGIAASATVFSVAKSVVMGNRGPMTDPERVVAVYTSGEEGRLYDESSFLDYSDLVARTETLEELAAHRLGVLTVGEPDAGDRVIVELVTGNYFQVRGASPFLGRAFLPEESVPGAARRVMVLSHRAWEERFGADPGVLGRTMELDGAAFTIIGVAPPGFLARYMKMDVDGWVPLGVEGGIYLLSPESLQDRDSRQIFMLGRLAPDRTVEEARSEMSILGARLFQEHPESWVDARGEGRVLTVLTEAESRVPPPVRTALLASAGFLLGGALFILLLACSNVASLLLARAHRRRWEMAVRVSLGAGRSRLVRMLLSESLILALGGGALGLYLAHLATGQIQVVPLPIDVPLRFDFGMDGTVLLFTVVLAVGASLLAGIGPALQGSNPNLSPALKHDTSLGSAKGKRITFRSVLVVGQVAAATAFVIGAGLASRSVQASAGYDVGLNPRDVAVVWEDRPEEELPPDALRAHFLELAARVQAHPEVESVALARTAEAHLFMEDFATAHVDREEGDPLRIEFNAVTPGYMEMLEIPLIRGRSIQSTDAAGAPMVAVVNQTFLDRFFPGGDGLGRSFTVSSWFDADSRQDTPQATLEVVGVVAAPERPGGGRAGPFFWISYLQDPPDRAIIHAKGSVGAEAMVRVLRQEIPATPGDFTPVEVGSYAEYVNYRFLGNRMISAVLSFAGFFALVLAFIGVFGVVSFAVNQRYREMAIRQAMGAERGQVVRTVLADGLRPTGFGIVLGLLVALPLAYLARSALLGVLPLDPIAVGGGTLLLVLASLAAGIVPARRLMGAQPMEILREE